MAEEAFPDDTDDLTPAAPIEDYVPLALLLGIYFAYLFLKARITKSNETMKKIFILFAIFTTFATKAQSLGINTDGSTANASAMLDVSSTSKGFLPPRMTYEQKTAISSPAAGLMVWCTNCGTSGEMQFFNGTNWVTSNVVFRAFAKPGAPTNPVATVGNAQASVAFTAPTSNGGSAITGYTVTSSPGGFTASGASSPLTVTGLTNGIAYTFTVVATNALGDSVASTASAPVVPFLFCYANVGGSTKVFMCYNLGVTGSQDPLTHQGGANNGALYQWGRQTDGHEVRTSATQAGPVAGAVASKFITSASPPYDWISPQDGTRWLDASKTANDPCPSGFRVPTQAQWGGLFRDGTTSGAPNTATRNTWTWTGNGFTVGANLYLPAAGYRGVSVAALYAVGTYGYYWSSTVNGTNAYLLFFDSGNVNPGNNLFRGSGYSVRCISE
ncbi:FISUMP domain-containing protein [Flavobacterium sp.]|uniref:FISUMP domain-containing protein n=1 Tax=Flavobacterium sp. TaxID=239 RepID=UPI0037BF5F49